MNVIFLLLAAFIGLVQSHGCSNTPNKFRLDGETTYRTCTYVADNDTAELCSNESIKVHCPATCDACHDECMDSTLRFELKGDSLTIKRSCTWVCKSHITSKCKLMFNNLLQPLIFIIFCVVDSH